VSRIIKPGAGILFMKVGTHAQETLQDIIARKTREIEQAGYAMWGYGGSTCHPKSTVQPFARSYSKKGQTIYLCMQEMESKHFAEPIRADEFSTDCSEWASVPDPINVLGSRYALTVSNLRAEEFELPLAQTRVAIGNCAGRAGSRYIRGHVDKACLEMTDGGPPDEADDGPKIIRIGLVADLVAPYAVFLRNKH
jgi:hypothetical protein